MNKIILLGSTGIVSKKVSRWLFIIIGIAYLALGINRMYFVEVSFEAVSNLILGVCFVIYSLIVFSVTPFTPKLKLDEEKLEFKNNVFGKTEIIYWSDIKSIEFGKYEVNVKLDDKETTLSYTSNPETSMDIKSSIREISKLKKILVISG